MPERFEIYIVYKRRYINTLPFLSFSGWDQKAKAATLTLTVTVTITLTQLIVAPFRFLVAPPGLLFILRWNDGRLLRNQEGDGLFKDADGCNIWPGWP